MSKAVFAKLVSDLSSVNSKTDQFMGKGAEVKRQYLEILAEFGVSNIEELKAKVLERKAEPEAEIEKATKYVEKQAALLSEIELLVNADSLEAFGG